MKRPAMGVKVEMENGNVKADLSLTMEYGYNIPATCSKVQTRVRQAVESMTGLRVKMSMCGSQASGLQQKMSSKTQHERLR